MIQGRPFKDDRIGGQINGTEVTFNNPACSAIIGDHSKGRQIATDLSVLGHVCGVGVLSLRVQGLNNLELVIIGSWQCFDDSELIIKDHSLTASVAISRAALPRAESLFLLIDAWLEVMDGSRKLASTVENSGLYTKSIIVRSLMPESATHVK